MGKDATKAGSSGEQQQVSERDGMDGPSPVVGVVPGTTGQSHTMDSDRRPWDDVVAMSSAQLEAELVVLARRLSTGVYDLLVLVGELDARGAWESSGSLSCAAWLADLCGVELSTARSQLRVARAIREHPALDEAMRSGDISYAKARVLVPYLTADNVDALVALAARTPAGRLGAAIAAWSQRNDDPDAIAARQHEARSVTWRTEPDGTVMIFARLPPASAAGVCAAIDAAVAAAHDAPAGASRSQQRADALVSLAASGGSIRAEIVVHVRADGNSLTDGTPLSDHAVAALLPDGFVSLLLHDNEGYPIDASPRRRTPTRRQRRVIDERYPVCAHPGCTATAFLQYDHIHPFAQGGLSTLDNLQRLCGPHNRARVDVGAA